MKVHVICRATHTDRVLPRLARQLAEAARWTMGDGPDAHADINYFFPYLEWIDRGRSFDVTRTAAWFTHRDTFAPGDKAGMWDEAAGIVDLRLTTARRNLPDLELYGPTRLVMPPVELDRFQPLPGQVPVRKRVPPTIPVVGVSGYIYAGGRKGEEKVAQLVQEHSGLHVVASGKGWPVANCREWAWEEIHKFYQSLDVYLCTGLLEGIPMPPLEALACGIPIVIPRDVGLLDDLPDVPGIARYEPGDYDDMVDALTTVINNDYQVEELRLVAMPYSLDAWRDEHERSFEDLLWPSLSNESLPDWKGKSGVYCVAFGGPSRGMAEKLVASVARHMPDTPTCVVSDRSLGVGEGYFVERPDVDIGGRIAKIEMYQHAPRSWQYILYLDADTEVVADVSILFQFLVDGWELVICKNPGKYHVLGMMSRPDNMEETNETFKELGGRDWLQLNGGVMAFRRCARVEKFFALWLEEWHRWGKRDQAALHRALWHQPLRMLVLGNEWNTITRYDDADITAGILHYPITARRWRGRVDGRLDSEEAWQAVIAG